MKDFDQPKNGAKEAKKGSEEPDPKENTEVFLNERHFELACFLGDIAEAGTLKVMALENGVNDASFWSPFARSGVKGFGISFISDVIVDSKEEVGAFPSCVLEIDHALNDDHEADEP